MIYTAAVLLGALAGLLMKKFTSLMVCKRTSDMDVNVRKLHKYTLPVWIILCSSLWVSAAIVGGTSVDTVKFAIVGTLCFSLSAVDLMIRKIPNELLISLIIIQVINLIIKRNADYIITSIGGLVAGIIIFMLPAFVGRAAGMGDVKLAAVIGFVLGFNGLIAAVLIMALIISGYALILIISKKGGLKTKLALGPYLTAGVITVMMFSIISKASYFEFSMLLIHLE